METLLNFYQDSSVLIWQYLKLRKLTEERDGNLRSVIAAWQRNENCFLIEYYAWEGLGYKISFS